MKRFLLFLPMLLLFITPASATDAHKIAAVVNDDIVSLLEVEDRMKLVIATTGISDSREVRNKLLPQIVRALIDEKLQMQAARQANITVSKDEIAGAVAVLEKQRGKAPGSLVTYLTSKNVPTETFLAQIEAQLSWNKLMGRKLAGAITISEEEMGREVERFRKEQQRTRKEVQISSVLLPVDAPEREAQVQQLAEQLTEEWKKGVDVTVIAAQLSSIKTTSAPNVWVELDSLEKPLAEAIRAKGEIGVLDPIRTPAGYYLIKVQDKREKQATADAEALFKEIVMRLRYDAELKEVDVLMDIARQVAKHPGVCSQKSVAGIESFDDLDFKVNYTRTRFSLMSPEILPLVQDLSVEQISEPFAAPDGIHLLMLCEKIAMPTDKIDLKKIRAQVLDEKYQLEAMRFLRNLRREAFVEVRL